ncbi:unnamed protein product [Urochloa decumbens]|uniref:Uncharacterized protein n=1 Tax=Urochloa decumbens TaxID=240449 RepID=A0ABC8WFY3_9POAL
MPGGSRTAPGQRRLVRTDLPTTPPASEAPSSTPSPPDLPHVCDDSTADSTDQRRPAAAEPERCFVDRSAAMEAEETRLRFALTAQVGNASTEFSANDVSRAVADAAQLDATLFPVVRTFPASYLVVCSTQEARDRALAISPAPLAATFLSLRPWTRLVRANSRTLYHQVGLELDGIPEHAWDLDTASKLLAKHAWVERLDPDTASKADMSTFKLTAWAKDPFDIPASRTLCIAEPEPRVDYPDKERRRIFANVVPYLRQKVVLEYPISIHLRSITDFSSRTPSSSESSPSEDGDSGPDGHPDRSYGHRRGVGPRLTGFRRRQNIAGGGGGGGDNGGAATGAVNDERQDSQHLPRSDGAGTEDGASKGALPESFPKAASIKDVATTAGNTTSMTRDVPTVHVEAATEGQAGPAALAATGKPAASAADWAVLCVGTKPREDGKQEREQVRRADNDPMQFESLLQPNGPPPVKASAMMDPAAAYLEGHPRAEPCWIETNTDPMLVDAAPVSLRMGLAAGLDRVATQPADTSTTVCGRHSGEVDSGTTWPDADMDQNEPASPPATGQPACATCPDDDPGSSSPPGFSRAMGYGPATLADGITASEDRKLHAFASQVQTKLRSPLAPRPVKTKRTTLRPGDNGVPKRSSRLANHPLANVPSAKRAEVVLMHRFELIPEHQSVANTEGKKAYDKLYKEGLLSDNLEAMRDIMPALRNASHILGMQA